VEPIVTSNTISEFLAHPLVVVLVGGLVAALVGQYLAASWESRRSALEQKHRLIADMAEQMAKLFSAANLAETRRDTIAPGRICHDLVQPIQDWTIFAEVFGAKLRAYYHAPTLADEWQIIFEAAYSFAHLSGSFTQQERGEHVERLDSSLDLTGSKFAIDLDLLVNRQSVEPGGDLEVPFARSWRMTRLAIEERRDQLARGILRNRSELEVAASLLHR
jgi:hypothetical protein